MGERKVLNKYFSPDFDPTKVPRRKMDYDGPQEVRMMLPFNMRCLTCQHFMYRGKKFNSKKETAMGEEYLGIKILRFWVKCEACRAPISFKTDPQNADYTCESGATRNVDLIRGQGVGRDDVEPGGKVADGTKGGGGVRDDPSADDQKDDAKDALEMLERRTLESKREIDTLDQLDEIRTKNKAREKVSTDDVLDRLEQRHKKEEAKTTKANDIATALVSEEELEMLAKEAFRAKREAMLAAKKQKGGRDGISFDGSSGGTAKAAGTNGKTGASSLSRQPVVGTNSITEKRGLQLPKGAVVLRRRVKPRVEETASTSTTQLKTNKTANVGLGLSALAGYGSSSSDDDDDDE